MSSGSRQWTFQFFGQNGQLIEIHPAVTPRGKMHNMCCLNSTLSAGGLLGHDRFVSLMFMKFSSLCDTIYFIRFMFDYCEWLWGKPKTVITSDFGTGKLRSLHSFQMAICIRTLTA